MNFVKTKLALDKMPPDSILEVWLDDGEPVESVSSTIEAEGYAITDKIKQEDGCYCLKIKKR